MRRNQHAWNLRTAAHLESDFYDVASFKAGGSSLRPLELAELGDVRGKSLLHLMCHFGMDTLSWARMGAEVTGADFSPDAIAKARELAAEVGVDATFVCANVYDLPEVLEGTYDIVVMTYGVLYWLPDLVALGRVVARFLKPGGIFSVIESHPMNGVASWVDDHLEVTGRYFREGRGEYEVTETYADSRPLPPHPESTWPFTVGELVTALATAGLRVTRVRELPVDVRQRNPELVQDQDGFWRLPGDPLPLMLTLTATIP
ncbi:class I SAM-dependent methyltransferase [Fodinicola feengrottensis]|uniref:Class I SAM-dependent methyltransferase n=2 Tax=Fodinicola feengrottensis TaxID=435914 RepID=A0ABN2GDN6_9ACTN